ncbi:MAG TPA: S-adenosylmethionine:tRNA ribosyltransferase-isomerase [Candidatus Elarobacter sp.]|nr:S-adenosylmethionine:tRNA ribosyltransferase-isomerase [Candidatus Elarobacter sp.]
MSVLRSPDLADAATPPERRGLARDEVRMLVTPLAGGRSEHARFRELPRFLRAGDLVVVNASATLPAALEARRESGEPIPVHVSTRIDECLWLAEPRGAVRAGETLSLPGGARAVVLAPVAADTPRVWYAAFDLPEPMEAFLRRYGAPIRYGYVAEPFPIGDYQTIFAREPGSSEMPSAGRPFSLRVLDALERAGVGVAHVILHCGVSSYEAPERPSIERFAVPAETAVAVNAARARGGRVIAVGTTVVRALESALLNGSVVAASGWTALVVERDYRLRTADGLLSGFHAGDSTHRWILEAFAGETGLNAAYAEAADLGYLRHEFGDVHLLLPR